MKIAFIVEDIVGQGVQYATAIIAREFARIGWKVDVLVSQVQNDRLMSGIKPFQLDESINLIYMPSRRGSRNGWFVRKYLKNGGANVVIAESNVYAWCVRWASFGIPKSRLPVLVEVAHGNVYMLKGWSLLKARVKNWILYCKFTALLTVNEQSVRNFSVMFGFLRNLRVVAVNNACIDSVFEGKIKSPPSHPWLIQKICPTLVSAGAYQPYKNHILLLQALKILKDRNRKVRVLIFGRGPLKTEYEEYIAKNGIEDFVSLAGFTNNLPAEIRASDGFVLSSSSESFGIVLAEGLACEVPCIATDAPFGPREILADGKYGRLLPLNDPEAMADAIVDCIEGKIASAPKVGWSRYAVETIVKRYLSGIGING